MTNAEPQPPERAVGWAGWGRELPRPEAVLLAMALLATLSAKLLAARHCHGGDLLVAWTRVALPDIAFLAGVVAVTAAVYAIHPANVLRRLGVLLCLLMAAWAGLNAVWVMVTGVQLHPGVLLVVLRHPAEFGPTVQPRLRAHPVGAAAGVVAAVAVVAYAIVYLIRLPAAPYARRKLLTTSLWGALVVTIFTLSHHLLPPPIVPSLGQVLGYSSHWNALHTLVAGSDHSNGSGVQTRHLPRVGERDVTTPPPGRFPPIVIVLLESVSHAAAALDDAAQTPMPTLRRLGLEGADLVHTRVPVSQTGKAFWAVLVGTTPDVSDDYAEAILADQPYEALPSLLRRVGYRSAFFQMAKGAFECAPGAMHNFGFDWAWFRENLEDPSADLGYLAGDDFRMLDPALAWATQDERPFLLMMITSVAHDPYDVPATFGPRLADREAAYLQAVRYTDAFLAELCRRLEGLALLDETLLCVLGDHGESLRPDAQRTRWVPYEEVIRIPWVIRWPGHVPAGLRSDWPCSQLDVTPTLLHLLGFDVARAEFEGYNALAPTPPDRRLYFSSWFDRSPRGYAEGPRKWVYWPHNGNVYRYDLEQDPRELEPVLATGVEREQVVAAVRSWEEAAHIHFEARRFREKFLYGHWWAFSSGRYGRAYYVP